MKKILSLVLVLVLLLSVVACGKKTETASFELNNNGVKSVITFTYQGDKVITQTAENVITYSESPIKDKEDAKAKLDKISKMYEGVKGIKHSIEYGDKATIEKISVNFEELDVEAYKKLPGTLSSGDISKGISFKSTEKLILNAGYKKVEK